MITLIDKKNKLFSQKFYNKLIQNIDIHSLSCSCNVKGHLIKHGFYNRKIKISGNYITLNIQRVLCKSCGKTHALLTKELVPYSRISMDDHLLIIKTHLDKTSKKASKKYEDILIENELINENSIKYIINKYIHFWSAALISIDLSINNEINFIIKTCLRKFKRQFMQIKNTINILFLTNNIS